MSGVAIPVTAQTSGAQSALAGLAKQLNGVQRSVSNLQGSLGGATRGLGQTARATTQAGQASAKAAGQFGQANRAGKGLTSTVSKLKAAAAGLAGAWGLSEIIKAADTYTNINNRLKLVTSSTENLTAVNNALFASANRTRSSYESTAGLYSTMARATKGLGLSQHDLIGITETLNQGFQISGATAQDAASGIRQLGQAMTGGVLRGEEFNALNDSAPRILEALAAGMGKPRSELKKLAEQGKLTSAVVVAALQNQSSALASEFAKMTPTIEASMTVLKNNIIKFVGDIDKATGASKTLSSVIIALASNLPAVGVGLVGVSGLMAIAFGGKMLSGIKAATTAVRGFTLALAANPIGLIAVGVATAITALVAFRDQIKLFGDDTEKAGDQSITLGDVFAGAWDAAKEGFGNFTKWFKDSYQEVVDANGGAVESMGAKIIQFGQFMYDIYRKTINGVIGTFVSGYNVITEVWNNLPAIMGDIAITAGNALIAGLEGAVNRAASMIKDGPLGGLVGGMIGGGVSFGRLANPNAGAAGRVGQRAQAGQQDYMGNSLRGQLSFARGLGERGQRVRGTAGGSGGVSTERGAVTPTNAAGNAGSGSADKTKKAIDELIKAREDLTVRMREADYTGRELAAAEALEAAGLDRNVRAAQGAAAQIVTLSNAVYDATKAFDDMTDSVDMVTEAKASLASATNELLSVSQPALAQHLQAIAGIDAEYASRMKTLDAMDLTIERRKELADSYAAERDLLKQAQAAREQKDKDARVLDQTRRAQDAQLGARAITDSAGAGVAQQLVQIERERDDALDALRESAVNGAVDAAEKTRIIATAEQEMTNVLQAAHMENVKTAMGELKSGLTTMFTGGREAMIQYFADLALQFIQAKLLAAAMGTSMSEAFSSFGGGGASGGGLGAILGMMGGKSSGGGMGGLLGGLLSFLPGRETGGPVSAGKPYVVGEKRPEVFVPRTSGNILPSTSVGGNSSTTTNTYNVPVNVQGGANAQQTGQQVGANVERTIRRLIRDEKRQGGR